MLNVNMVVTEAFKKDVVHEQVQLGLKLLQLLQINKHMHDNIQETNVLIVATCVLTLLVKVVFSEIINNFCYGLQYINNHRLLCNHDMVLSA